MREYFEEVLALQLQHSSENTSAMARRGKLIRDVIPEEIRSWEASRPDALLPFRGRINVQGRDGTGRKTFIPWVRLHSPELSPSAQSGWYAVYLFKPDGSGVFLCISHGSTRFDGRDFKPRSHEEAAELMRWGRGLLRVEAGALGFRVGVDLGSRGTLARAYENTTAFSKFYSTDALPNDATIASDLLDAVGLVGELYRAIELGRAPDVEPPEVVEAVAAVEAISNPSSDRHPANQGFGLSAEERRLVELQAMMLAEAWLVDHGFENIRDVSRTKSCDFLAARDGIDHVVEVKGTTAGFGNILLTANEVELHQKEYPNNVLIVAHDIDLLEMRSKASGGQVVALESWDIRESELRPLSYSCGLLRPE